MSPTDGLPRRIDYVHHGAIGRLAGAKAAKPPTPAFLRRAGIVAPRSDPDRYFDPNSRMVSAWLSRFNRRSLSVKDGTLPQQPTPDGLLINTDVTWETKRPRTAAGVFRVFGDARYQSPRLVIDGSFLDLAEEQAVEVLVRQLPVWGADYDEVVILLGRHADGYVHWGHGRSRLLP